MSQSLPPDEPRERGGSVRTTTLLDLVCELVDSGRNDREVVTTVLDLIEARRVRLVGQVREPDLQTHS